MKKLLILIFIICAADLYAQEKVEKPMFYYGIYGYLNLNEHRSDFRELPGCESCSPAFEYANALGFAVGGLFELPVMTALNLGLKIGYTDLSAEFVVEENIGNTSGGDFDIQNPQTEIMDVFSEHHLASSLGALTFEPYATYEVYKRLKAGLGLSFAYLLSPQFDLYEEIVRPDNVVFKGGSLRRNEYYGREIPDVNKLQMFITPSIGYEFELKRFTITPEIRASLPMLGITSAASWKVNVWQAGVSVKLPYFKPKEPELIAETKYVRDTNVVYQKLAPRETLELKSRTQSKETKKGDGVIYEITTITEQYERILPQNVVLESRLEALGVSDNGEETADPQIVVEEFESEEMFPLLPHVFFGENSADLSLTSIRLLNKEQTYEFKPDSLQWNTLEIYKDVLNIIGARLRKTPRATITITGNNNNVNLEKGNLQLSLDRANAIKDYLVNIWGIDQKRLIVKSQNLPSNPSNPNSPEGAEENRRAEIYSDNYEIIDPVALKTIDRQANPPLVRIKPVVVSDEKIKDWYLNIEQSDSVLRSYNGSGLPEEIDWRLNYRPQPWTDNPIKINFEAVNELGMRTQTSKELKISQVTIRNKRYTMKNDKRYDRYSLILFDFDKSNVTALHQRLLKGIQSKIEKESIVTITGYTDRTGTSEYNTNLARKRVEEVQKILNVPADRVKLEAIGYDEQLYDNNTPEGRSYSRTVQILIETPVKR